MISSPAPQIISLNTESLIDFDDLASLSRLAARRKLQVADERRSLCRTRGEFTFALLGLIDLQAGHPLCIGASMSQTCVMLTVLAPKPNPWRCSLQLAEQWPWSKFAHGHESGCSAAGSSSNAVCCQSFAALDPYAPEKTIAPYSITPRTITGVN